ncbi:MAG: RodZ domain-containing protein, partial [Candidatus Binatia bacterium]
PEAIARAETVAPAPVEPPPPPPAAETGGSVMEPGRAPLRPPFELRLTATSRQVWVWLSIDGGPRKAVSLTRGESAVFNANNGYVLSVDDAGGIEAMLNGEPLPSLGGAAQARRNLVIPSAELGPLGSTGAGGRTQT